MDSVFFFPVLTAVFYYLGARAVITEPLWRRYPPRLDAFLSCAACSGFWYGLGLGVAGWTQDVPFLGMTGWNTPILVGLMAIWWTPVMAMVMERSLTWTGPATPMGTVDPSDVDVAPLR